MEFFKLNTNQLTQIEALNSVWIEEYRAHYPHDTITQRYCEAIQQGDFWYVIKDNVTEQYITEFICVVSEIPTQVNWHDPNATSRITMSLSDNFRLLKMHPGFAQYVSDAGLISEEENGFIYVYVNFVLVEHRQLFNYLNTEQGFNIQIEPKENVRLDI